MSGTRMSPERYQELLVAERTYTDLLPEFDKLEQCGENCDTEKALIKSRLEQMAQLKLHFKPLGF